MQLRDERPQDADAIDEVTLAAFGGQPGLRGVLGALSMLRV